MDQRPRRMVGLVVLVLAALAMAPWGRAVAEEQEQADLVSNGGFEDGDRGWGYQQWKGKPLPGYIDKEDMHEGLASFRFHQDGVDNELYMAKEVKLDPDRPRDYTLSVALKPQGMPDGAARVRFLIDGYGWLNKTTGKMDIVKTGGTHDWRVFTVRIPAAPLKGAKKATIFIYHDKPSQGALGIDSLSLKPASPEASDAEADGAAAAPAPLEGVTYVTGNPVVIFPTDDARVAIRVSPDQALYRVGELPRVTVNCVSDSATDKATLTCRVIDGFGQTLLEQKRPADQAAAVDLALPEGHGYYEVIATLSRGGQTLAEARRSIGELAPPPAPAGDEPFGLWIQGREHYPELGVRWVREGVYWTVYERQGDAYLQDRLELFKWYRDHDIRVLAFPKHPHPHETSREVIEDTPEAWRDLEAWWTQMVRVLAPEVDAWGVVNEPITGHWQGSDELIMRYWKLMRSIVDQYDPDAPLLGPSLGLAPSNIAQYQNLLDMGFGDLIDAVEFHTYITHPDDNDLIGQVQRIRDMTREATGRDLPVWATEQGSSATYETELLQAQHLMRCWLVARKIGFPVVIWHMFSHPQGTAPREIGFGIFRNARERGIEPQPRPAGLAFGVMTRQLAGATYRTEIDYLGPSIYAYVFERPSGSGRAMVALWTTSQKTYEVTLPVGDQANVTQTGLFGRVEPLEVRDGLIRVTVDRNPRFIAPLPAHYLDTQPIARLDEAVGVLPGASAKGTLTITNPTQKPAEVRIEWLATEGWRFSLPTDRWTLQPGATASETLTVAAPRDMAIGRYQIYAKVYLNDKFVTSLAAPVAVLPQVELASLEPGFDEQGRAVLIGTLRRNDPALRRAVVQLADGRSDAVTAAFAGDEAAFTLPVRNPASDHLESLQLIIRGSGDEAQVREDRRLSFVEVKRLAAAPTIDGDAGDWPAMSGEASPAVRWGWDDQNLYLVVRVDDPIHIQSQVVTQMWKDDSLQIGLAPGRTEQLIRDFLPGLQEAEMFEFDVALTPGGPAMYRHRTMNKHTAPAGEVAQDQIRYAVRHADGVITYELRIPVEQVGLKPLNAGQILRGSLLVNANDGGGRRMTEWFGGIKSAKDPGLFGHLILTE